MRAGGGRLSIRRGTYRGAEGWRIVGRKTADSWPVCVFVTGPRSNAETVKSRLLAGDQRLFDGLTEGGGA